MWIYVISFILSTIFVYCDFRKKQKISLYFAGKSYSFIGVFGLLAVLLPSFIAGARDYTVGSDTSGYGISVFKIALNNSFESFYNSSNNYVKNVEPLYRIFVYVIAKVFGNLFWQFFLIEFIICLLVYIALRNLKNKYAWIGYFIFLTYFYSFTLNLMRQLIAITIVLYAFKYVKEKSFFKYVVAIIIAMMIQTMAVVGICIYPLYYICTGTIQTKIKFINRLFNKHRALINILLVIACGLVIVFTPRLIVILSTLKGSYGYQLVYMNRIYNPSWIALILMILTVFPFFIMFRNGIKNDGEFNFYFMILIMSTILWQITAVSQESYRAMLSLWILLIFAVPKIVEMAKNKIFLILYYIILGTSYFGIMFIYNLINNIYPYTSEMLGVY